MKSTVKFFGVCALATTLGYMAGCQLFAKAAPPAVTLVACVLQAANDGQSVAQIANTCGADAVAVIEVLVTEAQTNAAVTKTKAYHETQEIMIIAPMSVQVPTPPGAQ